MAFVAVNAEQAEDWNGASGREFIELEYERTSPAATGILTGLSAAQAGELTRLARDSLMAYASPDGVTMPGAAWLVTAHAV